MISASLRYSISLAAIIGSIVSGLCLAQDDTPEPAKPQPNLLAPKITISKETTWVTEPLRADGTVSYLEAINRMLCEDVTPENNACVMLYQAMGPSPEGRRQPDVFFRRMGIEPLPDAGPYFEYLGKWAREQADAAIDIVALSDMQSKSGESPWTEGDYPLIAQWLKRNEGPLRTIELATQRPKYFSPLVGTDAEPDGAAILVLLPGVQKSREFARALASRAMWKLGEGNQTHAWRDLMTMHRLGRLVGQGPTLVEYLVGAAIESMAIEGELQFLSETQPSARMLAVYCTQLDRLALRASVADKLDNCERVMVLDSVERIASGKMRFQDIADGGGDTSVLEKLAEGAISQAVDWDLTLKSANKWYDRMATALRNPVYRDRRAEVKQINDDVKKLAERARQPTALLSLFGGKAKISQALSDVMISHMLPSVQAVCLAEGRVIQRMRNLEVAFALKAYQTDLGSYPDSLEILAPKYIAEIPIDLFSGQALKYAKISDGYLLYSVGENEQDDHGRSFDDNPQGDDLVVRMPVVRMPVRPANVK